MQQSFVMIKREEMHIKRKRIECNLHGRPIAYRCETPTCSSPYICPSQDCLDEHFHLDGKLTLSRFDSKLWESKFQEVQSVLNNETLKVKEEHLTRLVSFFSDSLQKIHQEMTRFQEVKEQICEQEPLPATPQYFENINGFLSLSSKLERKLDHLRAKIIDDDIPLSVTPPQPQPQQAKINANHNHTPNHIEISDSHHTPPHISSPIKPAKNKIEADKKVENNQQQEEQVLIGEQQELLKVGDKKSVEYFQNKALTAFVKKHIPCFDWSCSEMVFSSHSPLTTCERFHDKLRERRNLLFLFLGEREIIGSFYTEPYPSVAEKFRKDQNSFIFILDEDLEDRFAVFHADKHSESHMAVSEKLLICQGNTPNNGDGLRTFQRNFESLAYFLPSLSFTNHSRDTTYNGVLKIKEFYILHLQL